MSTIREIIQRTLPNGTRPEIAWHILPPGRWLQGEDLLKWRDVRPDNDAAASGKQKEHAWQNVPLYPTDCFAVVAQLLEQSGAYHHIRMTLPEVEERAVQLRVQLAKLAELLPEKDTGLIEKIRERLNEEKVRKLVRELLEQAGADGRTGMNPDDTQEMADDRVKEDRYGWNLRLDHREHRYWIDLGRAWSLMLPFIDSWADRQLVLWGAREWMISTAQTGHDPIWFYKHLLTPEAILAVQRKLDVLNHEAVGPNGDKYRKTDRWKIEDVVRNTYSGSRPVTEVIRAYHTKLLFANIRAKHREELQNSWSALIAAGNEKVFRRRSPKSNFSMPDWWLHAFRLLIACDEASIRLGALGGEYFDTLRLGGARAAVSLYQARGNNIVDEDLPRDALLAQLQSPPDNPQNRKRFEIDLERDIDNVFAPSDSEGLLTEEIVREAYRLFDERGRNPAAGPRKSTEAEERKKKLRTKKTMTAYGRADPAEKLRMSRFFGRWLGRPFDFKWAKETQVGEELAWYDELRSISFTFSGATNHDHVCVFPKSRIPNIGNTIRNLSNHLALLPPRGIARATVRRGEEKAFSRNKEFHILLVPFPFRVSSSAFVPEGAAHYKGGPNWRWFGVRQNWLEGLQEGHLTNAIDMFCRAACQEVDGIDAIIFPELALNYEMYAQLALHISRNHPSVELFIAGTSERPHRTYFVPHQPGVSKANRERKWKSNLMRLSRLAKVPKEHLKHGNFVATTAFLRYGDEDVSTYLTTFQHKHHRWRLERHQIMRYGIWKALDPNFEWWENIETPNRNIEFTTFRGGSTLVALVCEDLARLEPCQQLIRDIGPNLVVALLMDGPQNMDRWSARYATVLADDPGSSVLTLTSMGLMPRSTDKPSSSQCIGLWKDSSLTTRELHLPNGAHAAVLSLHGERGSERTVDGRDDAGLAISWRFNGCIPIPDSALSQELPPEFLGRRA